jgi:hypothetical protein
MSPYAFASLTGRSRSVETRVCLSSSYSGVHAWIERRGTEDLGRLGRYSHKMAGTTNPASHSLTRCRLKKHFPPLRQPEFPWSDTYQSSRVALKAVLREVLKTESNWRDLDLPFGGGREIPELEAESWSRKGSGRVAGGILGAESTGCIGGHLAGGRRKNDTLNWRLSKRFAIELFIYILVRSRSRRPFGLVGLIKWRMRAESRLIPGAEGYRVYSIDHYI